MSEDRKYRSAQDLSATSVDYLRMSLPLEKDPEVIRIAITLVKVSPGNRHETKLRMLRSALKKLEKVTA